jgi:phosphatidylglycerol:prolipoprotein diacylglycerol transferase
MMHPDPLFYIFGKAVYAYGICMAVGIIACFAFLMFAFAKHNLNEEASDKILFIGVFATAFGIFMAMVFQSIYDYIADPDAGFELNVSMTFYGGLIGGVSSFLIIWNLYVFVIAPRVKKPKFLQNNMNAGLTDALPIIPIGIVIAHAFGRLGCFFGGCCYGKPTDAWYGIACAAGYNETLQINMDGVKVIPTQLFECIFLFVLAAVMIVLWFRFKFPCNFGVYAVAYGVWRFAIEYARIDNRGSFLGSLTPSQFWAIVMVILGIAYFFAYKYLFVKFMKHPELQPPVNEKGEEAKA